MRPTAIANPQHIRSRWTEDKCGDVRDVLRDQLWGGPSSMWRADGAARSTEPSEIQQEPLTGTPVRFRATPAGIMGLSRAQPQHRATIDPAVLQRNQRLAGPFEGELRRLGGADFALLEQREYLAKGGRHLRWAALAVVADLQPADLDVLEQQIIRPHCRDGAGRKADHHQPTAPRKDPQGCIEHLAAERIEDNIGASAVGYIVSLLAQGVAQICTRQVDDGVGAGRPNCCRLLGPGYAGKHAGTHRMRELDRRVADPARGT